MKSFSKKYKIKAELKLVYKSLTSVDQIEQWSGSSAKMSTKNGSLFSLWDGSIHGKNISIKENQIVQLWKEAKWEEFSKVIFNLSESKGITSVELIHQDIPDASFGDIKKGWDEYYMFPLKNFIESL